MANFARHDVDVGFKDDNSHDNLLETFFSVLLKQSPQASYHSERQHS